ncbi:XRE family transcriptional regulator [Sinirhodobacter populi]|uniref:XRE family transcriptional regulator n=1 Tax=Paenirhodobacter populi TaxID=2306993 RepID=A0A443K811_9RHOB|nr:helix-turn-helix transcriptional regulator [Sinirhodobacter populi]RWR28866.1 XRE family transcriptional regulator [Sinirhodobacter populi]
MSIKEIEVSKDDLRALRERIGLGQTEFGRRLYSDPAQYRKYEFGMRDAPPLLALLMAQWARHGMPDDLDADLRAAIRGD